MAAYSVLRLVAWSAQWTAVQKAGRSDLRSAACSVEHSAVQMVLDWAVTLEEQLAGKWAETMVSSLVEHLERPMVAPKAPNSAAKWVARTVVHSAATRDGYWA
jgi:hypothetical protein